MPGRWARRLDYERSATAEILLVLPRVLLRCTGPVPTASGGTAEHRRLRRTDRSHEDAFLGARHAGRLGCAARHFLSRIPDVYGPDGTGCAQRSWRCRAFEK